VCEWHTFPSNRQADGEVNGNIEGKRSSFKINLILIYLQAAFISDTDGEGESWKFPHNLIFLRHIASRLWKSMN